VLYLLLEQIYTARLDYAQHVFSNTIPRHS